jgi:deoxyribodipyrimidine photo-lyase
MTDFPPTRQAALDRAEAIDPARYARTRNHLDGAVSRLSPYLTHGVVSVPEVIARLTARGARPDDKIVMELAWREYWQHAWRHLGEAIFDSRQPPPAGAGFDYATEVPADVRQARTGVPVIDVAVRALYDSGYVHNHARMWLASYLVHLRKVDWRAGAAWMYPHLLDGDLAANTLSWQWVAGTWTGKPYLFNDENVARYAPALSSPGSAPDRSYEALDALARSGTVLGPERDAQADGVAEPMLRTAPSDGSDLDGSNLDGSNLDGADLFGSAGAAGSDALCVNGTAAALPRLAGRRVALVHPWMLGRRPAPDCAIGVLHAPFHRRFPWSAARWRFVLDLMRPQVDALWIGHLDALVKPLSEAGCVVSEATLHPGYAERLTQVCDELHRVPRHHADPDRFAGSFSRFWGQVGPPPAGRKRHG